MKSGVVIAFDDPDGTAMVSVRLASKHGRVSLTAADFDKVNAALGSAVTCSLSMVEGHVEAKSRTSKAYVSVARLLTDAAPRHRIHYLDESPYNLRPGNLRAGVQAKPRPSRSKREFTHTKRYRTDKDGTRVVGIVVEGAAKPAWLERAAYERLIADVGVRPWYVQSNDGEQQVCYGSNIQGLYAPVGRVLRGCSGAREVVPRDGDYLNLRKGNLLIA